MIAVDMGTITESLFESELFGHEMCIRDRIYGDDVFGFVTVSGGIKIHRSDCPNANQMLSLIHILLWYLQRLKKKCSTSVFLLVS